MKKMFLLISFLTCILSTLFSDISIDITLPTLNEELYNFGSLESEEFESSVIEIEDEINEILNKPLISKAISNAIALTSQIPTTNQILRNRDYSFSFGTSATAYTYTFDIDRIEDDITDFNQEDDINLGGGVHVIELNLTFPINKILNETNAFLSIAASHLIKDEYYFDNYFIQSGIGKQFYSIVNENGLVSWTPVFGQCNFSYNYNKAGALIDIDQISIDMEVDPDGSGILPAQQFTIQTDPEVDVGVKSEIVTAAFSFSSSLCLFKSAHLYIGSGLVFNWGKSYAYIDAYEELEIVESVQDYLSDSGSVSISGQAGKDNPILVLPFVYGGLQFQFSSIFLNIPLLYSSDHGLGAGLYLGVSF